MKKNAVFLSILCAASFLGLAGTAHASVAPGVKLSQTSAESLLRSVGVTWSSSGGCTNRANPHCTSFEQINFDTVAGVVDTKLFSGCPINITGGTEAGHAAGAQSHGNGFKVDITPNDCVSNYIRAFRNIGPRPGDNAEQHETTFSAPTGSIDAIYARESTHWDILFR